MTHLFVVAGHISKKLYCGAMELGRFICVFAGWSRSMAGCCRGVRDAVGCQRSADARGTRGTGTDSGRWPWRSR